MRLEDGNHVLGFFEDCTLQDLLSGVPTASEVKSLYAQFLEAIGQWNAKDGGRAGHFLGLLLSRYRDSGGRFQTVTLLRRYALTLGKTQHVGSEFENHENEWMGRVLSGFRTPAMGD